MPATIQQSVTFEDTSPGELFEAYLDPDRHAAVIGAPVSIGAGAGTPFWAFAEDAVRGHTLLVHPGELIVQSWRAQAWADDDPDSVLVLQFARAETTGGTRIDLTQVNVPDQLHDMIASGWHTRYWNPWRAHLQRVAR